MIARPLFGAALRDAVLHMQTSENELTKFYNLAHPQYVLKRNGILI